MRLFITRQILCFTTAAALAFVPAAFAQHSPSGSYGNALHPGVPSPGALRPPRPRWPTTGGGRIGGGRIGNGPSSGRRYFGGGAVYIPYPVYGAGFGMGYALDGFYATDYNSGPGYAGPYSADAVPPTVIINQNFQTDSVRPQFRDYSNVQLPSRERWRLRPPPQARWQTISPPSS